MLRSSWLLLHHEGMIAQPLSWKAGLHGLPHDILVGENWLSSKNSLTNRNGKKLALYLQIGGKKLYKTKLALCSVRSLPSKVLDDFQCALEGRLCHQQPQAQSGCLNRMKRWSNVGEMHK